MRILHVIPWLAPRYGGPAILVPQASVAMTERGHAVEIVTTNVDGRGVLDVATGHVTNWAGAEVTFHPLSAPRRYLTSWPLLADLRRRVSTFDIVHIHYLYRFHGLAAAAVARHAGVPYIIQAHGALDPWNRGRKRRAKDTYHFVLEDRIIRGASAFLCNSHQEEQSIRHLGYATPTFVIPNGIDPETLRRSEGTDILAGAGIDRGSRIVTFLGRISRMKGVDLLVESFKETAAAFADAHLVIAGPDDEGLGSRLAEVVADAGITARVSFIGPVAEPEKRALLQRSNVVVLPSPGESFGLAAAEAMAVGCPVVVSPGVAIQDIVQACGAGLIAERNPAEIARAVATILADPAAAKRMGEAGRSVVDQQFAWPVVAVELEAMYAAIVAANRERPTRTFAAARRPPLQAVDMHAALACPQCRGLLSTHAQRLVCKACKRTYQIVEGIPVLLPDPALAQHDEVDHHRGAHKAAQAMHFDRAGEETFETERPHGSPRLYRFLLGEKFRRATGPLRPHLAGASALTVCGGSGMDAEYLSRVGATVITSDLSLGAATRAKTRSARYGLGIHSIVADVEHLPFPDKSMDLVAVHDGLHHLDDPYAGLSEMARVARRWVVVTEPAKAAITRLAIWLGLALEREEAGNRVARMEPSEVAAYLEARGFAVLRKERYAMYYPHRPGRASSFLSQALLYPVVRAAWSVSNAVLGRFGNKMVVVAERVRSAEALDDAPSIASPARSAAT